MPDRLIETIEPGRATRRRHQEPTSAPPETPAGLGFRMPAEWEPHEATWIGWPHNQTDWPGKFAPIPWVYAEIVRRLVPGEIVRVRAQPKVQSRARRILQRVGVVSSRAEFFNWP